MKRSTYLIALGAILLVALLIRLGWRREYVSPPSHLVGVSTHARNGVVQVQGYIFDSGMRVSRTTMQRTDGTVLIRVYRVPIGRDEPSSGARGNFTVTVPLSPDVRTIAIGDSESLVTLGSVFGFPVRFPYRRSEQASRTVWRRDA